MRLMGFVYKQLAFSLSSRKSSTSIHHHVANEKELTRAKFNLIARKITKMAFGMGGTCEEKLYVLDVIMRTIVIEITKRSPKVLYRYEKKIKDDTTKMEFNLASFSKQFNDLRPLQKLSNNRTKKTKDNMCKT